MARSPSLNCLSCRESLPNPSFAELPPPFSLKNPFLGGHFGPEKKKILSPPQKKFPNSTLPAPRPLPLLETPPPPPSWDFPKKKNRSPPPLLAPRPPPSPSPSRKNKKYPERPPSFFNEKRFVFLFLITLKTVTSLNKEARLLKFHFS